MLKLLDTNSCNGWIRNVAPAGDFHDGGRSGSIGDGGMAASLGFDQPSGLAGGSSSNPCIAVYFDICRVMRSGIITTLIGGTYGISGNSGDGGAATSAKLYAGHYECQY
jgi:hypothetical protein